MGQETSKLEASAARAVEDTQAHEARDRTLDSCVRRERRPVIVFEEGYKILPLEEALARLNE
ncbi:MAG: hypothetical protein HY901_06620 [Deltaproteobacteria bacterium]|nr:hypothetical protein [Deltaproteobacteria bacterium]